MNDIRIEEEERISRDSAPRGKRRLVPILVVLILACFGTVVWYAYQEGQQTGISEITPIIKAEEGAIKVRPDQPGGMEIPHQDKMVYSQIDGSDASPSQEKLLPEPEEPMIQENASASTPDATAAANAETVPLSEEDAATSAEAQAAKMEPKVEQLTPPPVQQAQEVKEVKPVEIKKADAPKEEVKKAEEPKKTAETKSAAKTATPAKSGATSYSLQLASLKDKSAAEAIKDKLIGKAPDVLKPLAVSVHSVDLPGKGTYYRVYAGSFATRDEASKECAKVKAKGLDCIVASRVPGQS